MPSKRSRRQQGGLLRWFYDQGGQTAGQILDELFGDRSVGDGLAKTIRQATRTKGQLDRNMQALLALLNVPSRADYAKLAGKIEALQGSMVNLNIKLDRLLAASAAQPKVPPARASAPKTRSSSKQEPPGK